MNKTSPHRIGNVEPAKKFKVHEHPDDDLEGAAVAVLLVVELVAAQGGVNDQSRTERRICFIRDFDRS